MRQVVVNPFISYSGFSNFTIVGNSFEESEQGAFPQINYLAPSCPELPFEGSIEVLVKDTWMNSNSNAEGRIELVVNDENPLRVYNVTLHNATYMNMRTNYKHLLIQNSNPSTYLQISSCLFKVTTELTPGYNILPNRHTSRGLGPSLPVRQQV